MINTAGADFEAWAGSCGAGLHSFGRPSAEVALSSDNGGTLIEIDAPRDRELRTGDMIGLHPRRYRIFAA